jgi:hypothetical protein
VALKGFFERFGRRREEGPEIAVVGTDGWVEMNQGRIVVHDPAEDGRYATLIPYPGVRLWINDEEVDEPTAVTKTDQIRYEVAVDAIHFFELHLSADEMSVELVLTADPNRTPDTVLLVGRHQVRLEPGYSTRARPRVASPRQVVLDRLRDMEVSYGIDDDALDKELAQPSSQPVVIASGQEPQQPKPGQWVWKLDQWSLVEAGQVIAAYQDGVDHKPRITVKGKVIDEYLPLNQPGTYLSGNGTRIVPGGRLVSSASGRARAVVTPQGQRVHIFPVHRVTGDLTDELDITGDVLVEGSVRGAHVTTNGELLVLGDVEKSDLRAELITVRGAVSESLLCTVAVGHFVSLRVDFAWIHQRLEAMRERILAHQPLDAESFRECSTHLRGLRRKAEQMGVNHPEYLVVIEELSKVFMGAEGHPGLDLTVVGRLLKSMERIMKISEQVSVAVHDVSAGSLTHTKVWAGRHISARERIGGCELYAGGDIRTPEDGVLSQSDLVAAGSIDVGVLSSIRGTAPVTLRAGTQITAAEAQVGCSFEFGLDRREFKSDLLRLIATPSTKGPMQIRQRD